MKLPDWIEPSRTWPALVAAALLCGAIVLSSAWTRSPARPGRGSPPVPVATAPHPTDAPALRSDGHGGWYAVVEVAGGCTLPALSVRIERYRLNIVGTTRSAPVRAFEAVGEARWWIGDRFVAHLHSVPRTKPRDAERVCIAGCDRGGRDPDELAVVGLVPIDRDDAGTLTEIAAGRRPMPELSRYPDATALRREPGRRARSVVLAMVSRATPGSSCDDEPATRPTERRPGEGHDRHDR